VTVPVALIANPDAIVEWRKKFEAIANSDKRAQITMNVTTSSQMPGGQGCHQPFFYPKLNQTFFQTPPVSGQTRVAACFITGSAPGGVAADCFGREFMPQTADRSGDSNLIRLNRRATPISLSVKFLNKDGGVVDSRQIRVDSFPVIPWKSNTIGVEREFFSFCNQGIFFSTYGGGWGSAIAMGVGGDVILFPPAGSRLNGVVNVLVANAKIAQFATVSVSLIK
jgi:hypothetical protein